MKKIYDYLNFKNNFLTHLFWVIIFLIFIKALLNYDGSKFIYILFSVVFNFTIYKILFKKTYFFELIFGILIWLGFWFKFSLFESNIFRSDQIFDGRVFCNFNLENFDNVLLISSIGCLGFILSVIFINFFPKFFLEKKEIKYELRKKNFFFILFILFIFLYSILVISNLALSIYQKGLLTDNSIFFFTNIIYPYFYNIGFGAAICFFIYNLHNYNSNLFFYLIAIILLEGFFTNFSMLSRNMILYSLSIFLGYFVLINKYKQLKIFKYKLFISLFISIFIFLTSIIATNFQRNIKYELIDSDKNEIANFYCENKVNKGYLKDISFLKLLITRSIGIEGIMVTQMNKNILGFDLIKQSISEKPNNVKSFYENKFLNNQKRLRHFKNSNQVILPGIFGYLFFAGSKIFLFISIFSISIFCLTFERVTIFLTNNQILASFLSFCIVWRLVNFGYLVSNTLNFIISLIITLLAIYAIQLFLNKNAS
ncbi:hypothetical protein N8300_02465 [Pelagibacteraceae bacterium]|nr:hypothetical protein [Pelagibacteraceae bacterium]